MLVYKLSGTCKVLEALKDRQNGIKFHDAAKSYDVVEKFDQHTSEILGLIDNKVVSSVTDEARDELQILLSKIASVSEQSDKVSGRDFLDDCCYFIEKFRAKVTRVSSKFHTKRINAWAASVYLAFLEYLEIKDPKGWPVDPELLDFYRSFWSLPLDEIP